MPHTVVDSIMIRIFLKVVQRNFFNVKLTVTPYFFCQQCFP